MHRELENYVAAGIPPAKVLQIATLTAAQVTKQDKDLGSIARGKFADLIIVDGDPTKNISDIRKVDTVIKDGRDFQTICNSSSAWHFRNFITSCSRICG